MRILILVAALFVAACVTQFADGNKDVQPTALDIPAAIFDRHPNQEELRSIEYGPVPQNYEAIARNYLQSRLRDPESAMLRLAAPLKTSTQKLYGRFYYGWRICYWVNSKNANGGYNGEELYYFLVREGSAYPELAMRKGKAPSYVKTTVINACR